MAKVDKYGKVIWESTEEVSDILKDHYPKKFSSCFDGSCFDFYMRKQEVFNSYASENKGVEMEDVIVDETQDITEERKWNLYNKTVNIRPHTLPMEIILEDGVEYPKYSHKHDAGFDLRSNNEDFVLDPGERVLIKTGIRVQVPINYELQIRPRSGLALKEGLTVLNTPGTIDSGYQGDVGVILINHSNQKRPILKGDRIAQAVLSPIAKAYFIEVESFPDTERGDGGFGSTGK